jgi:hypothetical protein
VADGGVVVLVVVAGVHVRPLLAVPQLLGDVGMLVPVQLGLWLWVSAMANHLPPGLACLLEPTQVAGPGSPRLTAKVTAKLADNRGSWRTTLDAYTHPELRRCDRR